MEKKIPKSLHILQQTPIKPLPGGGAAATCATTESTAILLAASASASPNSHLHRTQHNHHHLSSSQQQHIKSQASDGRPPRGSSTILQTHQHLSAGQHNVDSSHSRHTNQTSAGKRQTIASQRYTKNNNGSSANDCLVKTKACASNNNNNNQITSNVGIMSSILTSRGVPHADEISETTVVTIAKATPPLRNKNEEAVNDLLHRIPEIDNIFDVHTRIGNGTFSTVLLGTLKKERDLSENNRRKFAIKHHIPTSHPDRIMKELQCMAKIGGTDNVVGINCCIRFNESVAFIMPYMPHDRFHDFFNKMDLAEMQFYMKNLLIALRHVHKFCVIHRDVKPSNFLYNRRKRQFLLVDFGLAQHVPALLHGNNLSTALEGKRSRELEDSTPAVASLDVLTTSYGTDVSGVPKRLRCTSPQGDQQLPTSDARISNSCSGVTNNAGTGFKMPLKQLNEISTGRQNAVSSSGAGTATFSTCSGICSDTPLNRTGKASVLGMAIGSRFQQKMRCPCTGNAITPIASTNSGSCSNCTTPTGVTSATNFSLTAIASAMDTVPPSGTGGKYNTNRNLSVSNPASKCYCYGKPQVCNICLIKKEIHASRAGTPGYRPPEVLLKYADQTTAVDVWAAGVIFLSILSSVYPFFKAPNDYVALAEMVTIFGDKTIRRTAVVLDRLVTLSQKTKPLDLRKLCVRFRNRTKFSSPDLLKKYQRSDGTCEVCKNCDQFYFNCLCCECHYKTEPLDGDDPFPNSAYDLLHRLLEVNPHERITAEQALRHPFFNETHIRELSPSSAAGGGTVQKKRRD